MADTMPVCRFCGLCQEESDLRRVKAKDTLLLLLCIMVEKEELSLSDAHGVYNECVRLRKRICRRHYSEAATYIGDAVSTICKVVVSDLFTETEDRMLSQRSEDLNTSRTSEGVCTQQSQSTDPLSQYTNPSDSTIGSQDIVELDETDPVLLDRHFLIKGSQLLKLFRFCPSCGSKISESKRCVRLRAVGTAPVVDYICTTCYPFEKRFEGQERAVPHPKEKSFRGNVQAVVAAITTGTRYVELQRWAEEADIALFSKSFFYKIFSVAAPCIEREYMWHQQTVLSIIREEYRPAGDVQALYMLSTLHFNTLRLAERNGSRTVARVIRVKRKFLARQSTVVIKTPVKHEWRRSILRRVLDLRMEMLQKGSKGILDPAEVPLHFQQLAEVEDSAADLQAQVMRVEGLRSGLIEGLELDMMEDPEYTDDNRLLQIAYNIVNYNTNTGDPNTQ
ncbi:hypothetical protein COOONC_17023 [Cooperia oncophora]